MQLEQFTNSFNDAHDNIIALRTINFLQSQGLTNPDAKHHLEFVYNEIGRDFDYRIDSMCSAVERRLENE